MSNDQNDDWKFPDINPANLQMLDQDEKLDVQKLLNELAILKKDYQALSIEFEANKKISTAICERLTQANSYIDEELIEVIKNIVNAISKKIIQRELMQDKTLIIEIIENLQKALDANNGPISIYVCEKDFNNLKNEGHPFAQVVKVDKLLNIGDVIIQSNMNEIKAVISESVENLLGVS